MFSLSFEIAIFFSKYMDIFILLPILQFKCTELSIYSVANSSPFQLLLHCSLYSYLKIQDLLRDFYFFKLLQCLLLSKDFYLNCLNFSFKLDRLPILVRKFGKTTDNNFKSSQY